MNVQKIDVLSVFPGAKPDKKPNYWILPGTPCPVCNGKDKLSVSEGDYRLFVKCWKKCDPAAILSGLGVSEDALYYPREPKPDYSPRQHLQRSPEPSAMRPASTETGSHFPLSHVPELMLHHHKMLHEESGISDQIIMERGYKSLTDGRNISSKFTKSVKDRISPGQPALLIPRFGLDGRPISPLLRLDSPRPDDGRQGKFIKYEREWESQNRLSVHPKSVPGIMAPGEKTIFLDEGTKKNDAAVSIGLLSMEIGGVWNGTEEFPKDSGKHKLIKDFDQIPDKHLTTIVITPDSDWKTNDKVHMAMKRQADCLKAGGFKFKFLLFEPGANGEKVELDTVIAKGATAEQLLSMIVDKLPPFPAVNRKPTSTQESIEARIKELSPSSDRYGLGSAISLPTLKKLVTLINRIESETRDCLFFLKSDLYAAFLINCHTYKGRQDAAACEFGPNYRSYSTAYTTGQRIPREERMRFKGRSICHWKIVARVSDPAKRAEAWRLFDESPNDEEEVDMNQKRLEAICRKLDPEAFKLSEDRHPSEEEIVKAMKILQKVSQGRSEEELSEIHQRNLGDKPLVRYKRQQDAYDILGPNTYEGIAWVAETYGTDEIDGFIARKREEHEATRQHESRGWGSERDEKSAPTCASDAKLNDERRQIFSQDGREFDPDTGEILSSEELKFDDAAAFNLRERCEVEMKTVPTSQPIREKGEESDSSYTEENLKAEEDPFAEHIPRDKKDFLEFWRDSGRPLSRTALSEFTGRSVSGMKDLSPEEIGRGLLRLRHETKYVQEQA